MTVASLDTAPASVEFDCPACGGPRGHVLAWEKNNYSVYRCRSCGLGRTDARDFDPRAFYDEDYFRGGCADGYVDYQGSEEIVRREFRSTLDWIRKLGPASGKLLEVGCAYGFFLQEARASYDVYGVEMADAAAAHCRAHGLHNVRGGGELEALLVESGSMDVAVMLDVIEHLPRVEETVSLISSNLRKGGLFVVTTGDWSSLVARLTRKSWRLMTPPGHLWYFTPPSIEALFRRSGLTLVDCSHPWKIVPIELILHQGMRMLGFNRSPAVPGWMKPLGLPANLFDAMRLAFRKTG